MRAPFNALFSLAAAALLSVAACGVASAQKYDPGRGAPASGDGGHRGGGPRGPGWGAAIPGIILAVPGIVQPRDDYIDEPPIDDPSRKPKQRAQRPTRQPQRAASNAPPANERRYVPDEVVVAVGNNVTPQQINALQARHRLTRLDTQPNRLGGVNLVRWRIPAGTSVTAVVRALEAENLVTTAQPNYLYALQQTAATEGDPAQYEIAKLRLSQAHALSRGDQVVVAVVDSGVDAAHPELAGSVTGTYEAMNFTGPLNKHGTAIAGLIAAHATLMGAAPSARILAVRVFGPTGNGTSFDVLKGLDYAAANGARVINMSFAGPADPLTLRSLLAAYKKGIVLIAAAGNAGPKSPPLYPAAYPEVIAVSGTDINNKPSAFSNRGTYIAVAAPGTDLMVAIPDGGYEVSSGTSYSAAEVSGVVALMLARRGDIAPGKVREILQATAKDIGPKGRDIMFGAGLADAFGAVSAEAIAVAGDRGRIERVSSQPR